MLISSTSFVAEKINMVKGDHSPSAGCSGLAASPPPWRSAARIRALA
jgi:hypothetical protein